jgi:predicted NBD/HSP70 family sugar kinase
MSQPAGQHTVRQHNRALVLRQVADAPRQSRAQLALATGLTRATVSGLVDELLVAELLAELSPDRGSRGRPGSPLILNANGPAGLGVEVNVDYISACVLDLTGQIRARQTELVDNRLTTPAAGVDRAIRLAQRVRADAEADGLTVVGASIGVAGLVDSVGVLRRAPNLPGWQSVDLGGAFGDAMRLPVTVDNEANLAALAQLWFGESPQPRDFVLVSGEIGVGAGVVLDGQLYRGVHGHAGELGHVVVDPAGPSCGCGANGCLEQVAGQEAMLVKAGVVAERGVISTGLAAPDGAVAELHRRAAAGDARTRQALGDAGTALGIAIAGFINVVDVPVVLLGGLYARLGEWLVAPISAELDRRVVSREWAPVEVGVSGLGSDACVRGAAATVINALIESG